MNEGVWIALIIAGSIVLAAGVLSYAWYRVTLLELKETPEAKLQAKPLSTMPRWDITPPPPQEDVTPVKPPVLTPEPKIRVYNPDVASTAPVPMCYCHKRSLKIGQKVALVQMGESEVILCDPENSPWDS